MKSNKSSPSRLIQDHDRLFAVLFCHLGYGTTDKITGTTRGKDTAIVTEKSCDTRLIMSGPHIYAVAEQIEPAGLHPQEKLDEDDDYLSLGTEIWEYEVADGKEQEFIEQEASSPHGRFSAGSPFTLPAM